MLQHAHFSIASVALGVSLVLARPSLAQTQYAVVDLGGEPIVHDPPSAVVDHLEDAAAFVARIEQRAALGFRVPLRPFRAAALQGEDAPASPEAARSS